MTIKRLLRWIDARDVEWFRRAAFWHAPALDKTLPRLTRAANKSVLWTAIAAALGMVGGRFGRRAAARGLLSIGISSAIANGPLKYVSRRPRPLIDDVPVVRRLRRAPRSTSFPSGHSASAFAFAVGASLEMPYLAPALGPLAGAVAFSRIYTGVHYPSDVIVGSLLGATVGIASRGFWPVAPSDQLAAHKVTRVDAPSLSTGSGVAIVVNGSAGPALARDVAEPLSKALPDARIDEVDPDEDDLAAALERAAEMHEVLGVCGGDGSINCAAQVALEQKRPLLVIPGGTLNHLARDIRVEKIAHAVEAVKHGDAIALDVATIDGKVFLNTASFGVYPELVDARERLESKIGKWPALVFALWRILRHGEPAEVEIDGEPRRIWMIFIGNCRYRPSGFAPAWRERLDDGQLDIRIVDAAPWGRTRLIASVLTGRLGRSRIYEQRLAPQLKVRSLNGALRLARDGETFDGPEEFVVEKVGRPLTVYAPVDRSGPPEVTPEDDRGPHEHDDT